MTPMTRAIQSPILLQDGLGGPASASAAETQSEELKILSRFLENCHAKSLPTDGAGQKTESDNSMRWVRGDSCLDDKTFRKQQRLWTFDRDERVYRCWYFEEGLSSRSSWRSDEMLLKLRAQARGLWKRCEHDEAASRLRNS